MKPPSGNDADASDSRPELGRRQLLQLGGAVIGAGTLSIPTGVAGAFAAPSAVEAPVSMAMHIHSSFSEGIASMDAHLYQANRLGVDVVWWTDHDFRASAFGYRTAVGFDGESEPEGPWDWTWTPTTTGTITAAAADFVTTPHSPDETGGALRIGATGGQEATWSTYMLAAVAGNQTYSTSYCDTTLKLDVRPEDVSVDAQIVVHVVSSYRPATRGRPSGQYAIQYRIGPGQSGYHLEEGGLLGVIGVRTGAAGVWQRVSMDLRADHARLWPDTFAGDASLTSLSLGVRARNGARAGVVVDRLRFHRSRTGPADAVRLQREAMAFYRDRYPTVTQFAASEISLVMHLNAFGGDHALPRYRSAYAEKDDSVAAQQAMVRLLHRHGAVVSINHPLGNSGGPDKLASRLIRTNGIGADVIEIGTMSHLTTLERVFDIAARNAVFLTANGATDDHEGQDWLARRGRWLTSVWSPSRRTGDLCSALKAGRAWFYDPLYWRGELDLLVDGTTRMGGVHLTRKSRVPIQVTATRLPRGSSLELVVGRCDLAGPGELIALNRRTQVSASLVIHGRWSTDVDRGHGVYVRVMARSHKHQVIGFSNPVWILPHRAAELIDIPQDRLPAGV
jgi:hypothetical protein